MKKIATLLLAIATVATATAGGLMTNSNQSAAFLRHIARGTTLDTDAVYNNPAGTAFMTDGWHLGINNQMAKQTRTIASTFAPFAMGEGNNGATKEFKGEVFSPLIPSFHLTWKKNRWAVMLGMGVNGGGGSLEFEDGLGSFERNFAVLPAGVSQLGQAFGLSANKYAMDMYLKGKSMTLAFNAGVAFRLTDWLSAAALVRYSVTSNAYEGHMKNIQINPTCAALGMNGTMMSAAQFFQGVAAHPAIGANPQIAGAAAQYAAQTADHMLDVEQKGTSISPILALYAQKGAWAASIKYEFKMSTELEIESAPVSAKDPVINGIFADGSKVKAETPALLAVAVSRQCGPVKVTAEWHEYFDKDAENSFSSCITGNTMEYLLGAEWQICDKWLVSTGLQRTQLDMDENKYSDMNFSISSWSWGIGGAYMINEKIRLNAGIMPTFYEDATAVGKTSAGVDFKDAYERTSLSWGLGLDFKF